MFLALVLAGAIGTTLVLARDGKAWGALLAAACAAYFALRLFAGLGKGNS